MMKNIYLAAIGTRSGKPILSLGLVLNYDGKAGYYKPFRENLFEADGEMADQNAALVSKAAGLESADRLSPFVYDLFDPVSMDDISSKYDELCKGKDFMVIEGSSGIAHGCTHRMSHPFIAKELKAPVVLVTAPAPEALEYIFVFREYCELRGVELRGVVLNKCAQNSRERKFLESRGIRVLGELPPLPELKTFKVSEISEKLGADIIAGRKGENKVIETMIVGAMSIQTAPAVFRRSKRKAVITCGDRTEVHLAALSTDTSCLIITGGIKPLGTVLSRAEELNVPVLMSDEDAMTIMGMMEGLVARVDHGDRKKIDLIKKTVRKYVDLESIWD